MTKRNDNTRNKDTSKATQARRRRVVMIGKSGIIRCFDSIKEASDMTGIPSSHICLNCRGKSSWAGGYQFRYYENEIQQRKSIKGNDSGIGV